jgi:hypothetical protein
LDREANQPSEAPPEKASVRLPIGLARTSVYRRVPETVRPRLDEAILLRPSECPTLEAIGRKFRLAEEYGVTHKGLKTYASRLERLVRPVLTAQVMAGALGCLPESYRQQLVAGTRVMLLSRVVQTLQGREPSSLTIADLAKLASILSAVARPGTDTEGGVSRRPRSGCPDRPHGAERAVPRDAPARITEAVRLVYGLTWPPEDQPSEEHRKQ